MRVELRDARNGETSAADLCAACAEVLRRAVLRGDVVLFGSLTMPGLHAVDCGSGVPKLYGVPLRVPAVVIE